ncbi:DUF2239 family protein [Paraburkholderia phymatum]|uniref:DUF2239 domain-containing protein n=1 Tax=Paraburkholderia phymatum (strain DSM 17167 / CIP 108236 / LMG 21445 / STM815) TaxID=391038 RepID=B2JKE1_PARP8|nr:DUF2239 family protein [Paraburkholderia phymatum]ACC69330.1 conserved hypothetical protein [Paraburkholderia phymatum STM815]
MTESITCTAFEGARCIASGELKDVALAVKAATGRDGGASVLIFDDRTGQLVELDLRGSASEVLARLAAQETGDTQPPEPASDAASATRGRGRPKLGVVAREVTLLPRHWEWLNAQSGGASVALRKLVDAARVASEGKDRVRRAQEAAYRFMTTMAGDLAGYEEATRALYANDAARFDSMTAAWPVDVREHARKLARRSLDADPVAIV